MAESEPWTELEERVIEEEESSDDSDTRGVDQGGGGKIPLLEEGPLLRQTTRKHQPSTRYPSSEYILIAYEREHKSF